MRSSPDPALEEIESLYRSRFRHFVAVARAITGDRELALEAVQEAFANVVRSRRGFRREGSLEAWVWRAVVNSARDARGRGRPAQPVEERRNGHNPEARPELTRAIAALPERQRLAVFLRYYADLDYRGIAAALDVEVGTVSATLSHAHAALRRSLAGVLEREVPK
jgi:RNA polymerase sigma factor (sigma-70 family)